MGKIITWAMENHPPAETPIETNSLFYAEDIVRYLKFRSGYSIKFCLEKSMAYRSGRQHFDLPAGSFFVVNEGTELECLPCQPGTKGFAVFFTKALLHDVWHSMYPTGTAIPDSPETPEINLNIFEHIGRQPSGLSRSLQALSIQMSNFGNNRDECPPEVFYDIAEQFFFHQNHANFQISGIAARHAPTREELFRRVHAAQSYMLDCWDAPLTLEAVARQVCLSPYHFHRSFRAVFGEPPMQWFKKIKLERARQLLSGGKNSVSEMALRCGFSEVAAFSKSYKRMFGVNPSER